MIGQVPRMRRMMTVVVLTGAMAVAGTGATMATADVYKGYETVAFTIERTIGAAEVRRMAPHLVAEVTVNGSREAAAGAAFSILAGYIFGANSRADKIAMTTPVTQVPVGETIAMTTPVAQSGGSGTWTVQFAMPSQYTLSTLPVPKDARIRLKETDPGRMLVLAFSGRATAAALADKTAELRQIAASAGLALGAGPVFRFYDSPFTLPWNRRNEVAFSLP
jgi:hypothetical protein